MDARCCRWAPCSVVATRRSRASSAGSTAARAEVKAKRTALWVHLYDPHDPYEPPEPFATRFADRPYDGEVAWTDTLLGRLRASLEARQLWNDALVVVTADHGEALGEHDETGHGFFAYETTLQIPLVMRGPGVAAGATVAGTVRLVDLAPTALALLGLPALTGGTTGTNLAASLIAGGPPVPSATTYAESLTPLTHYQWSDLRVLREGPWKYILAPRPELYDLASDPGETRDLSTANTATARRLRAALEGLLRAERERALATDTAPAALSADTLQKLGALGYVSPGAAKGTVAQGADPKDKIDEFRTLSGLMRDGLTLLQQKQYAESAAKLTDLRRAGADSFQVHFYLGRAQAGLGRWREAEQSFERAIVAMPNFTQAHVELADARLALRNPRGAIEALQRGQRDAPNEPELFDREGQVWQQLGDPTRAMAAYQKVATLAPKDALVRWRMGELLLSQRQPEQALAHFKRGDRARPRRRRLLELARHGARRRRTARRGGAGVPRGGDARPEERPVRLQPRPGADASGPARGGRLVPPRPDARSQVRAGAPASRGTGAMTRRRPPVDAGAGHGPRASRRRAPSRALALAVGRRSPSGRCSTTRS